MMKIGVTGGIGSGKSVVCRIFSTIGIPVYDSDTRAKELMEQDAGVVSAIKQLFGEDAYDDGKLNRSYISSRVFNDNTLLASLNQVVHPAVAKDFIQWTQKHPEAPFVIKEAAIMFESGANTQVDKIINITAPEDLRIRRIIARDGRSEEQIKKIISKQLSDEERNQLSDYVIVNDDKHMVLPQVLQIRESILADMNS